MVRSKNNKARPSGREAVREAIVAAAARLFSERGIGGVAVRDVAAAAKVNHGLVHRHFGSKGALVQVVMDSLAAELADPRARPRDLAAHLAQLEARLQRSRYPRVLAHALLEGHDPRDFQHAFPVLRDLVAAMRSAQKNGALDPDLDARVLVALGAAAGLGWLIFEPYLLVASGIPSRSRASARKKALAYFLAGFARSPKEHSA